MNSVSAVCEIMEPMIFLKYIWNDANVLIQGTVYKAVCIMYEYYS